MNGRKTFMGKKMILPGKSKELAYKELNGYKNGILSMYALGEVMKSQMSRFSDKEIKELSLYISRMK